MTNFSSHFVIFSHVSYVCVLHFPKQFYKLLGKVQIIDTFDSFFCFSLAPSPTPTFFQSYNWKIWSSQEQQKKYVRFHIIRQRFSVISSCNPLTESKREVDMCVCVWWCRLKNKIWMEKNLESCYECLHSKHKLFHGKWKRYEERDPICGENFTFFFLFVYPPSKSCAKLIFIV